MHSNVGSKGPHWRAGSNKKGTCGSASKGITCVCMQAGLSKYASLTLDIQLLVLVGSTITWEQAHRYMQAETIKDSRSMDNGARTSIAFHRGKVVNTKWCSLFTTHHRRTCSFSSLSLTSLPTFQSYTWLPSQLSSLIPDFPPNFPVSAWLPSQLSSLSLTSLPTFQSQPDFPPNFPVSAWLPSQLSSLIPDFPPNFPVSAWLPSQLSSLIPDFPPNFPVLYLTSLLASFSTPTLNFLSMYPTSFPVFQWWQKNISGMRIETFSTLLWDFSPSFLPTNQLHSLVSCLTRVIPSVC